jgi:hypothetical protein
LASGGGLVSQVDLTSAIAPNSSGGDAEKPLNSPADSPGAKGEALPKQATPGTALTDEEGGESGESEGAALAGEGADPDDPDPVGGVPGGRGGESLGGPAVFPDGEVEGGGKQP